MKEKKPTKAHVSKILRATWTLGKDKKGLKARYNASVKYGVERYLVEAECWIIYVVNREKQEVWWNYLTNKE